MKYTYADLDAKGSHILNLLYTSILYQSHRNEFKVTLTRTDIFEEVIEQIKELRNMISETIDE